MEKGVWGKDGFSESQPVRPTLGVMYCHPFPIGGSTIAQGVGVTSVQWQQRPEANVIVGTCTNSKCVTERIHNKIVHTTRGTIWDCNYLN